MKTLIITTLLLTSLLTNAQKKLYFDQITTKDVNLKTEKERKVESYNVNNSYLLWDTDNINIFIEGELLASYNIVNGEEVEKGMFKLNLQSNNENIILYWSHENPYVVLFYPRKKYRSLVIEIRMESNLISHRYKKESTTYTSL